MNFIQLRNGPLLREDAVLCALSLEQEGRTLSVRDGRLNVTDGATLTPQQRHTIQTCRLHLMALIDYAMHPPEAM